MPAKVSLCEKVLLRLVFFGFDEWHFFRAALRRALGRAANAASSALATSRGGDLDAFLAHVLEQQVNGADCDGEQDEGYDDCQHDGVLS